MTRSTKITPKRDEARELGMRELLAKVYGALKTPDDFSNIEPLLVEIQSIAETVVSNFWQVAPLADKLGISRTAVLKAVDRGELPTVRTGNGLQLVFFPSAKKWADNIRRELPPGKTRWSGAEPDLPEATRKLLEKLSRGRN